MKLKQKKKEKKRNFKCYLKQKNINCDRSKKAILFELYYCNLNKGLRDHRNSELMIHISKKLQMTHLNIKTKIVTDFLTTLVKEVWGL